MAGEMAIRPVLLPGRPAVDLQLTAGAAAMISIR